MSDLTLQHRPALAGALGGGVTLTALPEGRVALLLGRAGAVAPHEPGLRPVGPGQWYMVGDAPLGAEELEAIAARLPDVAVCDQSHGRVRIAIEGPCAATMLAKGVAVDLETLPVGASATTMVGPLGVHLTRTGVSSFELIVLRSFAVALWRDLSAMAAEY
jgi:sarcosine oxidase subunit gamma